MNKYYQAIINTSGDAKALSRVQVLDSAGDIVTIYADKGGTRFTDATGANVNYCEADATGMVEFYWTAASGQTLQVLDSTGELERSIADFANNFSEPEATANVDAVLGVTASDGDLGTFTGSTIPDSSAVKPALQALETAGEQTALDVAARPTFTELASTDPGEGAALVGLEQGGTIGDAVKWIAPEMFDAVGDAVYDPVSARWSGTDDSAAFQAAINYLEGIGGGKLLFSKNYLIGGLEVDGNHIVFEGLSRSANLIVKDGTLGIWVKQGWVHFRSHSLISQGFQTDGLGTSGVLYAKEVSGSIGHVYNYDWNVGRVDSDPRGPGGFSGIGHEYRNGLDITQVSVFYYKCKTGLKFSRIGTGGADFTTTVQLINNYVIGCSDFGIDGEFVYRSQFNVIGEYCGTAVRVNVGDVTLQRCYFENNNILGADMVSCGGSNVECYSNNPVTDAVQRSRGVIANAAWQTITLGQGDCQAKRIGVQNAWGRDPKYLTGVGTTDNIGAKYGEYIIPFLPGEDLIDQEAWSGKTTTEYLGWDVTRGMQAIVTALTGIRGCETNVTLDSTKTYVAYYRTENVAGNALANFRVDGVQVASGVPFTVGTTGSKLVDVYVSQSIASENYLTFHLFEVLEDQSQIVKGITSLLSRPKQRLTYGSAPPVSGKHAVGETVINDLTATQDWDRWRCTVAGNPGTWKGFGGVEP